MNMGLEKLAQDICLWLTTLKGLLILPKTTILSTTGVLIERSLVEVLNKFEIKEIDCLNKPFDPNFEHAVLLSEEEGVESGLVTEVLQKDTPLMAKF